MLPERLRLPVSVNGVMKDPPVAKAETYEIPDEVSKEVIDTLMGHTKERGGGLGARVLEFITLYRLNVTTRTKVRYTFENATPDIARNATIKWKQGKTSKTVTDVRLTNSAGFRVPDNLGIILLMIFFQDPAFVAILRHHKGGEMVEEGQAGTNKTKRGKGKKRKADKDLSPGVQLSEDGRAGGDGGCGDGADGRDKQLQKAAGGSAAGDSAYGRADGGSAAFSGRGSGAAGRGGAGAAAGRGCAGAAAGRGRGVTAAGRGGGRAAPSRGRQGGYRGSEDDGVNASLPPADADAAAAAARAASVLALADAEQAVAHLVASSVHVNGNQVGTGSICPNLVEFHGNILPSDVVSVFLEELAPGASTLSYPFAMHPSFCLEPGGAGPGPTTLGQCTGMMRSVWSVASIGYVGSACPHWVILLSLFLLQFFSVLLTIRLSRWCSMPVLLTLLCSAQKAHEPVRPTHH